MISQAEENEIWFKLQSLRSYDLRVFWNFYNNGNYSRSVRVVRILATSEENATKFAYDNIQLIEDFLRSKHKLVGRKKVWLVRISEKTKLTPMHFGKIRLSRAKFSNLKCINAKNGEIVHVSSENLL